jgi:iron(III) transport system substrate-binding protein
MKLVTKPIFALALFLAAAMHLAYAGAITVYTALEDDEINDYMKDARKALPDINLHVLRLSTGDLSARLIAEANNPHADVIWGQAVTDLQDPRIYNQLETYHAKGEKKLPAKFRDPNGRWFAPTGYMAAFCVNKVRLKQKNLPMPTSWQDLTKPAYKGEVVMPSPASSGTGYLQIIAILQALGHKKGFAFLQKLGKNVAQYTGSGSGPCKLARRGEYAVGASFAFPAMQSIWMGYPIKMVIPSKWVGYELEDSGLMKSSKNKADAKRFLDWTLSQGVAQIYAKYKEIVSIPGTEPSPKMIKAGLPKNVSKVLYPINFTKSAKHRDEIVKTWERKVGH